jgi:PAS domain S-box-containing protein
MASTELTLVEEPPPEPAGNAARLGAFIETLAHLARTRAGTDFWARLPPLLLPVFHFTRLDLAALDAGASTCRLRTLFESRPDIPLLDLSTAPELGLTGRLLRSGERLGLWQLDRAALDAATCADPALEAGSLATVLSLRIDTVGMPVAVLHMGAERANAWDETDLRLAAALAAQLGLLCEREAGWVAGSQAAPAATESADRARDMGLVLERLRHAERRLAIPYAVTRRLAQSRALTEAARGILEAIGETLGWKVGVIWEFNARASRLHFVDAWHSPAARVPNFLAATRGRTFAAGHGLPGRVWASGKPIWTAEFDTDEFLPRAPAARADGLRGAFGIPLLAGDRLLGVIEFFSEHIERPDDDMLQLMSFVGTQIGLFLDHRHAEESLDESERRFARFMHFLPGLAWIKDASGRYIFANHAAESAFGRSWSEISGRRDDEIFAPETARHFAENDRQAIASGTGVLVTETLQQEDGPHVSLVSKFPILDGAGRTVMVGGVAFDITEQIRAQHALRLTEERFRLMAETVPCHVWAANASGAITWANSRWYEFSGLTAEQTAGYNWVSAIHPDDRERCLDAYATALSDGSLYQIEVRNRRADGQYRWLLTQAVPTRADHGAITGWIGTSTDIDDLKRAQEALRQADRRKDEFLATLAHELRNPLQPIRNALEVLSRTHPEGDQTRSVLEMLERQTLHMVRLVDDLLEVSRITRGKLELRRERIALQQVIDSALETSRPLIEAAGHELVLRLPDEPVILDADLIRMAQVLANLLNNAAKYTERGGCITLRAARHGNELTLRVRDTGIGIPHAMLPRIFEVFTQVEDRASRRTQEGLGIGLAVVRSLVEMHGGTVHAYSNGPGQGSEFVVRLPLPVDATLPEHPAPREPTPELVLPPHRVLVVDDNRDAAESLGLLLQTAKVTVRTAGNGRAALAALADFQPNVIVLDIGMPGMDGYEVARRIKQLPEHAGTTLIALTGWGQDEDRRRCREAGFHHHFVKPVDVRALRQLLASLPHTPPPGTLTETAAP